MDVIAVLALHGQFPRLHRGRSSNERSREIGQPDKPSLGETGEFHGVCGLADDHHGHTFTFRSGTDHSRPPDENINPSFGGNRMQFPAAPDPGGGQDGSLPEGLQETPRSLVIAGNRIREDPGFGAGIRFDIQSGDGRGTSDEVEPALTEVLRQQEQGPAVTAEPGS
jgi:hypothetical protein